MTGDQLYNGLAHIYDHIMSDISYEDWADFIDEVIQTHYNQAETILELACGTGTMAISLDELEAYQITATDASEQMLEKARSKAEFSRSKVTWKQMDFYNQEPGTYDVVLMLFDSMNYADGEKQVLKVFNQVNEVLREGGLFIFDFTTPVNSQAGVESLNEEGITADNFRFTRVSTYLEAERIHVNEFEIEELSEDRSDVVNRWKENHKQRIYTLEEIRELISLSDFDIVAEYEGFDLVQADEKSDRITMILK